MTWNPPPATCVRQAWLVLPASGQTVALENRAGGWFCTSLDLGYPTVRAVTNPNPDADGIIDRTQYFGERTVTADVTAVVGAGARIDDVADNFAPFMQPAARPVLHYVLDRPGVAERTITLRPAGYAWKVEGDQQRDIQLQWVAADPNVYDPAVQTVIAWSGSSTANGRLYPLTYNRTYPTGGGTGNVGIIAPHGDLPVQPLLRFYGPVTAPRASFAIYPGGGGAQGNAYVAFAAGFVLAANQWVDVDTKAHTAYRQSDPTQPAFGQLNFGATIWPVLPPTPAQTQMTMSGSGSMSGVTQVQAIWQDAYLT